jgi:tRNA pseudouridine55 synthase
MNKPRIERREVHGWIALDKAVGQTSTDAVAALKRMFRAKKAGHAGTLDPLASGILPIAFGEATKTVPFVMDGEKAYRFTVRWGIETDSDDSDGAPSRDPTRARNARRSEALPAFTGTIEQTPPKFPPSRSAASAPTISRDRARRWNWRRVPLNSPARSDRHARRGSRRIRGRMRQGHLCARHCARSRTGARLFGHVSALRRVRVGPFSEANAVTVQALAARRDAEGEEALMAALLPVESGLASLPSLSVSAADAQRLAQGQAIILRGRDAPILEGMVSVLAQGG